jgi:hypothetical protein
MKNRYLIPFMGCILALIVSEYFLLSEMYRDRRPPVIAGTSLVLLGSIISFWFFYRKFRKAGDRPVQA